MRIILSPAKKMKTLENDLAPLGLPVFLDDAQTLLDWLRTLSYEQAKRLWVCSDKIAQACYERLEWTDLHEHLTPAVLAYDGIAFTYMAPSVFDYDQLGYVQEHLRILSGFYGALKPMDGVAPYRLEMQAKAPVNGHKNLYDFWGSKLYEETTDKSRTIVNLASKEYSKAVERYLQPEDTYITCTFAQDVDGKLVQKGVYCKMARGEMVRFMAANDVSRPEQLREFDSPDWHFSTDHSTPTEYVFVREG